MLKPKRLSGRSFVFPGNTVKWELERRFPVAVKQRPKSAFAHNCRATTRILLPFFTYFTLPSGVRRWRPLLAASRKKLSGRLPDFMRETKPVASWRGVSCAVDMCAFGPKQSPFNHGHARPANSSLANTPQAALAACFESSSVLASCRGGQESEGVDYRERKVIHLCCPYTMPGIEKSAFNLIVPFESDRV